MAELISKREFARREKCDEKLVRRGIAEGRLKADDTGKLDAALVGTGWRKGNVAAVPAKPEPVLASADKVADKVSAVSALPDESLEEAAARIAEEDDADQRIPAYAMSLAKKEHFIAILRELEVLEKKGELVSLELAKAVLFSEFRAQRDAWLNWPVRVGPELAADLAELIPGAELPADRVTELLTAHVHKHITALGDPEGKFERQG